jgi:putative endonuclease
MYHLYILQCSDKSLYTGITTDVKRRFNEHRLGKGGHYTRARKVVKIVYSEKQKDRSSASKRELEIKGWSRNKKLKLIKN